MENQNTPDATDLISMTADIVIGFVGNNAVRLTELPEIISSVHATLLGLTVPKVEQAAPEDLKPAVSIKKSVTDEYIISLEDGRKFKSMKRYLAGLGMTPDDYRAKWGLPRDYPMVAPGYAAKRSELAKAGGLGRKAPASTAVPAEAAPPTAPEAAPEPVAEKPKRGRPRSKVAEAA